MDTRDAVVYIEVLAGRGLIALKDGQAVDCAIIEQATGRTRLPCPWLESGVAEFEGGQIPVVRLVAGHATRVAVPDGWRLENLFRPDLLIPVAEVAKRLEFVRQEDSVDVYRDRATGELLYAGRTTDAGRRKRSLWTRLLPALRRLLKL